MQSGAFDRHLSSTIVIPAPISIHIPDGRVIALLSLLRVHQVLMWVEYVVFST